MRCRDFLDNQGGSNVIKRVLVRGRHVSQSQRRKYAKGNKSQREREREIEFGGGRRGHELRNVSSLR